MKKKVLITGLGSVGQRHARCLRELFGDELELHAFRSRGLKLVINDNMSTEQDVSPINKYGIVEHGDLDAALGLGMDAVFVTNPPDLHIKTAQKAVETGANVFIEKPLSHTMDGIEDLIELSDKKKVVCMVGQQLRYHIITQRIRETLSQGLLGKLTSAELVFAEYLPGMHPYEDYRISHAASEKRGGGAILSLNHDIDIACHLFGLPNKLFCMGGHYSHLEMDAEDTAHILMEIPRKENLMVAHILLDFVQRPTKREWSITGERGSLQANLVNNTLKIHMYSSGQSEIIEEDYSDFQRNKMFLAEIRDFFDAIEHGKSSPMGLAEARDVMNVAIAAKDSMKSGKSIYF